MRSRSLALILSAIVILWVLPNAVHRFLHRLLLLKLDAQGIFSAAFPPDLFLDEPDR